MRGKDMPKFMNKKVISMIGPPGSGKGTQADLVAEKFGLYHFDTGEFLKRVFKSDSLDEELKRESELYYSGKLNTPSFVTKKVKEGVKNIVAEYPGIVFSGSPRTVYEAENLIPFLAELVGNKNILFFYIDIGKEESVKRVSSRLICEKVGHSISILPEHDEIRKSGTCLKDGSRLIKKGLESPQQIEERFNEYTGRTKPVIDLARKMGYEFIDINGEQSIMGVFNDIKKYLE